ncbi:hypothetical protein [Paenibacillus sp. O199]|uniref:hypothetical protein n=1 Tax=Paenibacillus sp. O199 TaxID=1643925 RepID=UPI0007BFA511|nr:hypothetical protein [Paenibacillus sp. O199]
MNFTVDWGTLVVSVPVMIATCFGTIKFIGKAMSKEYFDKRLASYTLELQKDLENHRSTLEKDRNEYIKRLEEEIDKNKKFREKYTEISFTAIQAVREEIRICNKFSQTKDATSDELLYKKQKDLIEVLDSNRVYIPEYLVTLVERFIKIFYDTCTSYSAFTYEYKENPNSKNTEKFYAINREYSTELKSLHEEIEKHARKELAGAA